MDFKRVPPIPTPEEMMDIAFGRATKEGNKVYSEGGPQQKRIKKAEATRVKTAGGTVMDTFKRILNRTPKVHEMPVFYQELIATVVDMDRFRRSLASLEWATDRAKKFMDIYSNRIRRSKDEESVKRHRRDFYGRLASVLKQIRPDLDYLRDARERLKNLPKIEETFTVVIAGPPNVGKSTLLSAMTPATPRVESYPFTTQGILLGYFEENYQRYQIVDTPGLLDRPLKERNPVERHAILALKHLADVVIYVFDLSLGCGFSLEAQENIYRDIIENFPVPVIPVINKGDLLSQEQIEGSIVELGKPSFVISARERVGLDDLMEKIKELKRFKDLGEFTFTLV
jgi:nucleolar GTP-binding protein